MPKTNDPGLTPYKITFGGWYQRTTLHLSELFEFFAHANTYLDLDPHKIRKLHDALGIVAVTRQLGNLEYIEIKTLMGIVIRYYEDGLYVLMLDSVDVDGAKLTLERYYEDKLAPAISYLFSLGAPTPKILANIKVVHPVVVTYEYEDENDANLYPTTWLNGVYSSIEAGGIRVIKARNYIFIHIKKSQSIAGMDIVEMQIFFREFKDQLERYLNIHRKIWEEIADIKERHEIRTSELTSIRSRIDGYAKTISLISNRINQMGSYARTRKAISQQTGIDSHLVTLFQYRFEVLLDTLDYIKEIWKMTADYVTSAAQVIVEAQNAAAARGIQSLTLITSIGVLAGLIAHLSRDKFPTITPVGFVYFMLLLGLGWGINWILQQYVSNKRQTLTFKDVDKDI